MFYATFSDIDFNRFLDVMSFGASEAEIVSALSYYETVMETVQSQTMHMAQLDNRFAEANKLFDAMKRPRRQKYQRAGQRKRKERTGRQACRIAQTIQQACARKARRDARQRVRRRRLGCCDKQDNQEITGEKKWQRERKKRESLNR